MRFQGTVAEPSGRAVTDVEVALEARRSASVWKEMARESDVPRVTTRTDERGQFALDWTWDPAYHGFELVVTLRLSAGGREVARELARLDVGDRVDQGSPVSAGLVVEDPAAADRLRSFVASVVSPDETRIFTERGLPESVDRVESPAGVEAAWWYFESGLVVRFLDGALTGSEQFPPVRPIGEGATP